MDKNYIGIVAYNLQGFQFSCDSCQGQPTVPLPPQSGTVQTQVDAARTVPGNGEGLLDYRRAQTPNMEGT